MINLLPDDYKNNIIYARHNWHLRKWIFWLLVSLFGSLAIIAGGYIFMDQSIKRSARDTAQAQMELPENVVEDTRKAVEEISTNTNLVKQVLSKEVLFSKLIARLGASLPRNTTLEAININSLDGSITLNARAKDINAATQIQVNLEDPENEIFVSADIESIDCESQQTEGSNPQDEAYPCAVQLKALFAPDNPFTYIAPAKKASSK